MRRALPMIACLPLLACSPRGGATPSSIRAEGAELWVDAARGASGDGSRERPHATLGEALARAGGASRIHLAPGRYPGAFTLPAGLELEGEGAVLEGAGSGPVLRAPGGAWLRGVEVRGGGWGVEAGGALRLESVRLVGQVSGGVRLGAGTLAVTAGRFEAGGAEAVGLRLEGGSAQVRQSVFSGDFWRSVEARDAEVALEDVDLGGARTALHQSGGQARLTRVTTGSGSEVGLFCAQGTLWLEDVTVTGHEYGVQVLRGTLESRGLTSRQAVRAGVTLVGARGVLEDTRVLDSGDFGALSLVGSDTVVRGLRVERAGAYGLTATRGRLRLERALFSGLTSRDPDGGDGLHLRDIDVEARQLVVRDAVGVGVLAAQGTRLVLRDASLESCHAAGVWSESLARVEAVRLVVRGSGGPALVALGEGVLRAERLVGDDNAGGLAQAADCEGGTRIAFRDVAGRSTAWTPAPCVGPASP
jgi:hypothetical protein